MRHRLASTLPAALDASRAVRATRHRLPMTVDSWLFLPRRWCGSADVPRGATKHRRTYFDLFHLPIAADLNIQDLQKRYHQLQAQVHPDQSTTHNATQAHEQSSLASKAYVILKDEYLRCRYLSQLIRSARSGASAEGSDNSVAGDCVEMSLEITAEKMDPAFLSEVMRLNVEVNSLDPSDPELQAVQKHILSRCEMYATRCRDLFASCGAQMLDASARGAPPTQEELDFHRLVREWTYYNNVRKQVHEILG